MLVSSCYEHRISPSKGGFKRGCAEGPVQTEKQNSCQLRETAPIGTIFRVSHPKRIARKVRSLSRKSQIDYNLIVVKVDD
ncbi:hypothetical protein C3731_07230 [Brucella oryzae]|uniref:Uncharacterized protein n=1 Tax=Brucella oryzae TaxID=335286 RepID=A0A2S7J1M8_9HYPH|nr:hypothetical protein C3731_07230 [Brucella oryzae]